MTVTSALIGMGVTFSLGDGVDGGSTVYAKIGEVVNVTPVSLTREAVDATHLESPDDAREFIPGLLDGEPAVVTFNYVPSASDPLYAQMLIGKADVRITFKNGVKMDVSGVPTNWSPGEVSTDKMTGSFTLKPSGLPTLSAA